jgi:hypothetical protein
MPVKKRKKKRRYQRGTYSSPLAGECNFRSGWEQKYMAYLDSNPDVRLWSYEKLIIKYISNKASGKIRKYYPDFFVEMKNGERIVVEIKQKRKLDSAAVKKKSAAAEQWCMINNASFLILTELELKDMGIL